ncbi:VTT domain-containing protein [Pontibacter sp. G13]|uniref:TVP38/TMEM64 family protein n=1 Tax=Pontibacter sp. G13 TaxID=3074898 RepID=UPI00288BF3F8|nr:VTT domain-containing protein [Pontibacter sp. G13]WNJ18501.1 VTT domain-containing protein [Pontibacter sp. G13]
MESELQEAKGGWTYWGWIALTVVLPLIVSSLLTWAFQHSGFEGGSIGVQSEVLFYLVASLTMALALTPTTFVAIASGFLFGWEAWIGIVLSYTIAATIGRLLGIGLFRRYSQSAIFQQPRYTRFLDEIAQSPLRMLILARLSPVLPFAVSNMVLGQIRIPWGTYLAGTLIGMIPRTMIAFITARNAQDLWTAIQYPETSSTEQVATSALIILTSLGIFFLMRRAWKRAEKNAGDK